LLVTYISVAWDLLMRVAPQTLLPAVGNVFVIGLVIKGVVFLDEDAVRAEFQSLNCPKLHFVQSWTSFFPLGGMEVIEPEK
jgi:hypothetical protein